MEPQLSKSEIYSSTGERHPAIPADIPLAGVMVDGVFFPGFPLYGVPVGSDTYVEVKMEEKMKEIAEDSVKGLRAAVRRTTGALDNSSVQHQVSV